MEPAHTRVRYGPITKGYFLPSWLDLAPEEIYKKMAHQGNLDL